VEAVSIEAAKAELHFIGVKEQVIKLEYKLKPLNIKCNSTQNSPT
jgi:hypothetical protein